MNWHARVRDAFAAHGHSPDSDIVEELSQHAASAFQAARAEGGSQDDAEHQVRLLIEAWVVNAAALRRRPRRPAAIEPAASSRSPFAGVLHDARYGLRVLRREPGFMAVAILTMALGIGATTSLFSVAYGVLLKPLPWPDADRLVRITETRGGRIGRVRGTVMNGTFLAWADHPATVEALAGWTRQTMTMIVGVAGVPGRVPVIRITPSAFPMLKARAIAGRVFAADEGARGAPGVALISYGLWQEQFAGSMAAIGQAVRLDDQPHTVVGVMPREFAFPDRETRVWIAWAVPPVAGPNGAMTGAIFSALARLRPGATPEQATAEATARARNGPDASLVALALFGEKGPIDVRVTPAREALTADVRPAIVVLLVAVGLLLTTATANVASLQLARATTRRHEIAVRAAIGASASRLTCQLLVESAILGLAGGATGLALAALLHRVLPAVLPADFPRLDDVAMDGRVLLFAVVVSLGASVVCGLLPALHARRIDLVESLSDGGAQARGGSGAQTAQARTLIMAGQVAVACVLLVGAALLGRSFVALIHADRGYDPVNVLSARLPVPPSYSPEARTQIVDGVLERVRTLPGVTSAAASNALPFVSAGGFSVFQMPSPRDPGVQLDVQATQRVVTPAYFEVLRLHVAEGRALSAADTATSPPVLVVNRSFARAYLGEHPVGSRFPAPRGGAGFWLRDSQSSWEVVGVVDDMRQDSVEAPAQPELFVAFQQAKASSMRAFDPILVVRTTNDPLVSVAPLRAIVHDVAPALALDSVMTMDERVMTSLARPRTYALLLGGFAVFALAIAGVGLFGVLSYTVAQRTREIGVRTALGAQTRDIVGLIFGQGMAIAAVGVGVGLIASAVAVRSLSAFLYGVAAYDAASFIVVGLVLAAVAVVACVVPARRAANIDPLRALRES